MIQKTSDKLERCRFIKVFHVVFVSKAPVPHRCWSCRNLLLPAGVPMERQRAAYRVVLHRAEDLPRMDTGIMASVKKAMMMNKIDFIDAYVRVSFVGNTASCNNTSKNKCCSLDSTY